MKINNTKDNCSYQKIVYNEGIFKDFETVTVTKDL